MDAMQNPIVTLIGVICIYISWNTDSFQRVTYQGLKPLVKLRFSLFWNEYKIILIKSDVLLLLNT